MAAEIVSVTQYDSTLARIRMLQERLRRLALAEGNLDPAVLALSQEIDRCVVSVQRYWAERDQEAM